MEKKTCMHNLGAPIWREKPHLASGQLLSRPRARARPPESGSSSLAGALFWGQTATPAAARIQTGVLIPLFCSHPTNLPDNHPCSCSPFVSAGLRSPHAQSCKAEKQKEEGRRSRTCVLACLLTHATPEMLTMNLSRSHTRTQRAAFTDTCHPSQLSHSVSLLHTLTLHLSAPLTFSPPVPDQ